MIISKGWDFLMRRKAVITVLIGVFALSGLVSYGSLQKSINYVEVPRSGEIDLQKQSGSSQVAAGNVTESATGSHQGVNGKGGNYIVYKNGTNFEIDPIANQPATGNHIAISDDYNSQMINPEEEEAVIGDVLGQQPSTNNWLVILLTAAGITAILLPTRYLIHKKLLSSNYQTLPE